MEDLYDDLSDEEKIKAFRSQINYLKQLEEKTIDSSISSLTEENKELREQNKFLVLENKKLSDEVKELDSASRGGWLKEMLLEKKFKTAEKFLKKMIVRFSNNGIDSHSFHEFLAISEELNWITPEELYNNLNKFFTVKELTTIHPDGSSGPRFSLIEVERWFNIIPENIFNNDPEPWVRHKVMKVLANFIKVKIEE